MKFMSHEEKKNPLKIVKRNLNILLEDHKYYADKFLINFVDNDIYQNLTSIPFFYSSLFYPNSSSYFLLELVNFFGELEKNTIVPYQSYSQSLTTYCLKLLERKKIIQIKAWEEMDTYYDLKDYEEVIGTHRNKKVSMYLVQFYKLRDLNMEDLPTIKNIARMLKIDFSIYNVKEINNKLELQLKGIEKAKNIVNGKMLKNIVERKKAFSYIFECLKEELFYEVFEEEKISKKRAIK